MNQIIGSHVKLATVSAELKMARSLVRLTDIQATLKEQKILFVREQIRHLEEKTIQEFIGMDTSINLNTEPEVPYSVNS